MGIISHKGEDAHFLLLLEKISVRMKEMKSRHPPTTVPAKNNDSEERRLAVIRNEKSGYTIAASPASSAAILMFSSLLFNPGAFSKRWFRNAVDFHFT